MISRSRSTPNCSWTASCATRTRFRTSAAVAWSTLTMKFACFGEICAPPDRLPLRPAASMSRPARSSGGFLKTLPRLRIPYGCDALRSAWIESVRSRTRSGSSSWTRSRALTMAWPRRSSLKRECRYLKSHAAARRVSGSPLGLSDVQSTSTSATSVPKAPALPNTLAPHVPGTPMPNSSPARPRDAQSSATRGIMQPAPSSTVCASATRTRRSLWRTTSPWMPESLMSALLPAPTMVTVIPEAVQRRSSSASTVTSRVVMNQCARPPTPNWLCRARGSLTSTPGYVSSQSPADTLSLQGIAEPRRQLVEAAEGEHQEHIAGASDPRDHVERLVARCHHVDGVRGPGAIGDVLTRHGPGHAALAGLLDRSDDHHVGAGEAAPVVLEQPADARVGVRCVDGDEAASRVALPRGVDGGADLGRMVRVVVDDRHARNLAEDLKAARGAAEVRARAHRDRRFNTGELGEDERRAGVLRVMEPRERKHHVERCPAVQLH